MNAVDAHTAALEEAVFSTDRMIKLAAAQPVGGPEAAKCAQDAETALVRLQTLLSFFASGSECELWSTEPLLADCLSKLHRLRLQSSQTTSRQEELAQLAKKAGCPEGFKLTTPPNSNLLEKLRARESFSALLAQPRPSRTLTPLLPPPPSMQPRVFADRANLAPTTGKQIHPRSADPAPPPGDSRWAAKVPRGGQHHDSVAQARFSAPQPKQHQRSPQQHHHDLYDGMDEDMGEEEDTNQAPGFGAFQTAATKYVSDLRKEGKDALRGPAPRVQNTSGLRRAPGGGGGYSGPSGKFVPPFVKKALQAQAGGGANGGNAANSGANKGPAVEEDGPLTARTLELLKLSPGEPLPEELSRLDLNLVEQVCNEVIDGGGAVTWDDIAGQDAAKKLIQEVVVWPMLNPEIFKGARAPPKGILLFGPPGTGKTLLGKAIASNIRASFFSISASSLTSKWIGEGEKMVRALFAVAGWLAPAVIFIDEIDSLLSARKAEGEHEASRRLKTEMLVQMEGCDPASAARRVLLIGATNRPEELDEAARRRMPKQLYIPLPCGTARREMVLRQLGPGGGVAAALNDEDLGKIMVKTEGYSGSDMKNLIQEACQGPVRDAVRAAGAGVAALQEADLRAVVLKDFAVAARAQRASVEPGEVLRYEQYNERHGAKILGDGAGGEGGAGGSDDDW